ncbi:MAG: hypothetical protein IPM02_02910 [Betaproteobacteria bacterium]|nr:hypothetical protein [Betaproteobacteria bacterium]
MLRPLLRLRDSLQCLLRRRAGVAAAVAAMALAAACTGLDPAPDAAHAARLSASGAAAPAFSAELADARSRDAAFEQAWRMVNERFYDPGFNGVDWEALPAAGRARAVRRCVLRAARAHGGRIAGFEHSCLQRARVPQPAGLCRLDIRPARGRGRRRSGGDPGPPRYRSGALWRAAGHGCRGRQWRNGARASRPAACRSAGRRIARAQSARDLRASDRQPRRRAAAA